MEDLLTCSASLPLSSALFPLKQQPGFSLGMVLWGGLDLEVSSPVLLGHGEGNLGCQVDRERRETPVPQLSGTEVI